MILFNGVGPLALCFADWRIPVSGSIKIIISSFCSAYLVVCIVLTANSAHYHKRCQIIEVASRAETPRKFLLTSPLICATLFVRQEEGQHTELQCPVRKSKQFGGRTKTGSHTRPEQRVSDRVWLFHLPDGKEAPLWRGAGRQYRPPQGLNPEKQSFPG